MALAPAAKGGRPVSTTSVRTGPSKPPQVPAETPDAAAPAPQPVPAPEPPGAD